MSIKRTFQAGKKNFKLTFSLPVAAATNASKVQLLGDFNNWDPKVAPVMKKGKEDYTVQIELASPNTYQFRYLIDGNRWQNDFSADGYVLSPFGGADNSVIMLENPVEVSISEASKAKTQEAKTSTNAEKAKASTKKEVVQKPAGKQASPVAEVKKSVKKTSTAAKK